MKYTIYMLKDEHYDKLFMNYDYVMVNGGVNMDEYEPVYSGTIESLLDSVPNMLESLFALFNCSHPADYRGRSLSVSDIIVLEDGTTWFCDSVGFKQIQPGELNIAEEEATDERTFIAVFMYNEPISECESPIRVLERECGKLEKANIILSQCALVDHDVRWENYITYLVEWAIAHSDPEFEGLSPMDFNEWLANLG